MDRIELYGGEWLGVNVQEGGFIVRGCTTPNRVWYILDASDTKC